MWKRLLQFLRLPQHVADDETARDTQYGREERDYEGLSPERHDHASLKGRGITCVQVGSSTAVAWWSRRPEPPRLPSKFR